MSQQKKLERVLDLLLSEDSDQASELLHQIIVEKARTIYESIVDEEDDVEEDKDALDESEDEVGGEPNKDFTDEIGSDQDEVEGDHENDGEPEDGAEGEEDGEDDFGGEDDGEGEDDGMGEGSTEERVEDLETQLAELRAEFDQLMGEEMQEPEHADMADEFGGDEEEVEPAGDEFGQEGGMPDFGGGGEEHVVGEVVARISERKKAEKKAVDEKAKKLEVAKQAKKEPKGKKVEEETQFLNKVADTGQRGTAKLVGTGKGMTLGAEQNKSSFTNIPARKDYGGKPTKIGGNGGTGGEYGKYHGDSAADKTMTDNVNIEPKKNGVKADTTAKYTGGKVAGDGFSKSPLSKKPR